MLRATGHGSRSVRIRSERFPEAQAGTAAKRRHQSAILTVRFIAEHYVDGGPDDDLLVVQHERGLKSKIRRLTVRCALHCGIADAVLLVLFQSFYSAPTTA